MPTLNRMLFMYVETPLHAGSGRGLGTVDLPIQRERLTDYPMVQASGLKGSLRAAARTAGMNETDVFILFGPETDKASDHAGALAVGDARIALFPVRSLGGVFAYTTSCDVLARLKRSADLLNIPVDWSVPTEPPGKALVTGDTLQIKDSVVLEEFSYKADASETDNLKKIGQWIASRALPAAGYEYWADALQTRLCVLPQDAFRDFTRYATEVQTHVSLVAQTKTADEGALFTSESLPTDTVLYAPLMVSPSRRKQSELPAEDVLAKFTSQNLRHVQLGGDETTGQGMVLLNIAGGQS